MVIGPWLEDELKKRRQRQINAAVSKARAEEREKARADVEAKQALQAVLQQWETWNRNREAAQAVGADFTQPPPSPLPPQHYC